MTQDSKFSSLLGENKAKFEAKLSEISSWLDDTQGPLPALPSPLSTHESSGDLTVKRADFAAKQNEMEEFGRTNVPKLYEKLDEIAKVLPSLFLPILASTRS